jgi:hypothetical protein
MLGEFVVIVLSVLVALAVDDWRQYRANRELQTYLLGRLSVDLLADAADLVLAQTNTAQRQWMLEAVAADLSDGIADGQPFLSPPDSLSSLAGVRARLEALGRTSGSAFRDWEPRRDPLIVFRNAPPEFDLTDDTFQEMIASGTLQSLPDPVLRSEITRYYRIARDFGDNTRRGGQYQARLEDALALVGVATADPLSLVDIAAAVDRDPRATVEIRRSMNDMATQQNDFQLIEAARSRLASLLERGPGAS